jgi:4-hydroxymandelate oxidase
MTDPAQIRTVAEFEPHARQLIPHSVYEFAAAGAGDEITLRRNETAYDEIQLWPRVFADVTEVRTETNLFGYALSLPLLLAPAAYQGLFCPEGELAPARAAARAQIPMILSTNATIDYCTVKEVSFHPPWFQIYLDRDRTVTQRLVTEIEGFGCPAFCLTVDTPVLGSRTRQFRAGFNVPLGLPMPHQPNRNLTLADGERLYGITTLEVIRWLRSVIKGKLLVKGLLHPNDVDPALDAGVDGIIVSNHGARNLDTVPATIDVLPLIAEKMAGRAPIIVDGGIRRGTDVVKALGRGANAVMIGRPYLWAMAVAGSAGVARCIEILQAELVATLTLIGRTSAQGLDRTIEFH